MQLFWDRGYEGATFDELATAMGIGASSFHNAFGSKERLYREATELYLQDMGNWFTGTLAAYASARDAFQALIEGAADLFTRCDAPAGCMISLAGTHCAPASDSIREMMAHKRALSEQRMCERLSRAVLSGELPPDTDVAALAAYFGSVFRGMAVQARDGAGRERLLEIGRLAMRVWPETHAPVRRTKRAPLASR
ncbi:MAG: TetR/AcrR family transcriptional regulator [Acidisphaera sp.]|nr:TetR/AcrR family transcriptional regulator [Acidisphaera sp.]MBV9811814.1 TetR/AcrR family transcriptional regulator [Acetobacteraceae bacterium]